MTTIAVEASVIKSHVLVAVPAQLLERYKRHLTSGAAPGQGQEWLVVRDVITRAIADEARASLNDRANVELHERLAAWEAVVTAFHEHRSSTTPMRAFASLGARALEAAGTASAVARALSMLLRGGEW